MGADAPRVKARLALIHPEEIKEITENVENSLAFSLLPVQQYGYRTNHPSNPMKKILLLALGIIGTLALASCGTMRGFGEDLERAGDAIQGAAHR